MKVTVFHPVHGEVELEVGDQSMVAGLLRGRVAEKISLSKRAGITGTQDGATLRQILAALEFLSDYGILHHGCVGADYDIHKSVRDSRQMHIVMHRGSTPSKYANIHDADEVIAPKNNLMRNNDIVNQTEHLFALPKGFEEERRSGTWATVRYAEKVGKPVTVIFPDGSVSPR